MTQLIKYEAACRALAECKAVDEVKSLHDKAAAMQAYGRMAKDRTLELDASEIRIRAERRLGEMLSGQKADGGLSRGAAGAGVNQHSPKEVRSSITTAPKLSDAGISKDLSSRAQKLAAVPEAQFEAELAAKRERERQDGERVTARLERAGEKVIKAKTAKEVEAEQAAEDAHSDFDPLVELENANKEIETLHAQLDAIQADDPKAEALKWRKAHQIAERRQSELMDAASHAQKHTKFLSNQLQRCGRAVGEKDPDKIASMVEAFVREHTKAAA